MDFVLTLNFQYYMSLLIINSKFGVQKFFDDFMVVFVSEYII
jgi:hypothetical protein